MAEHLGILESRANAYDPGAFRRNPRFRIGNWTVSPQSNSLSRGDETVRLEPKVMDVLLYLAERPGEVVTREELESSVWAGTVVTYDALTGAIQKLRKAFNDNPRRPRVIETLSKKGYRLVAAVTPVDEPVPGAGTDTFQGTTAPAGRPGSRLGAATLLLLALAAAGSLYWLHPWRPTGADQSIVSESPSIAVLPFDDLSGDADQGYLADGLTDDLITGLAKIPELLVIARDSTFVYKGEAMDVREVADRLNVRYVLRGSLRRAGERVHINAQLVDGRRASHLWAESYDGPLSDVFQMQDRITGDVLGALALKVGTGERQDLGTPRTANPQAYESFLLGRQRFYHYANKDENEAARRLFERATELDPDFALAYAMLGWTHAFDAMNGWSGVRERSLQRAEALATHAIGLQPVLPVAYFVRGLAYREQGEYVKALVEAEKAIQYDPNYANAHVLLATLLYYAGRPEEGLKRIQRAIQLNPHHPYNYTFHLGQAYFVLRRYGEAIAAFEEGLESNPSAERLHVWLAAALAQSGDLDEARWEADQVLSLNPDFSLQRMQDTFPFQDPNEVEHFIEGLRKTGMPGG